MVTPTQINWPMGNPSLQLAAPKGDLSQDLYYKIAQEYLVQGNTVYYPSAAELRDFNRVCAYFRQYQWDPRQGTNSETGAIVWTFNAM